MQAELNIRAAALVRGLDDETDPFASVIACDGRYEADFGRDGDGHFLLRGDTDEYRCLSAELIYIDSQNTEHRPVLSDELQSKLEELADNMDIQQIERMTFRR